MKIMHITDFGRTGKINGVSEAVLNLAKTQEAAGAEVVVGHTRPNDLIKEDLCYQVDKLRKFDSLIREFRPDIVVFNSFYDIKHPLFAFRLKRMGVPYVITFHGGASRNNYQKHHIRKLIANSLIFKPYIRNAKAVCYLNQNEQQNSIFKKDAKRWIIIPNGINMPHEKLITRHKSGNIEVLFFSRLDYIGKGLDILLQSIDNSKGWLLEHGVHFSFYGYHYNDGTVEKIQSIGDVCEYRGYVLGCDKEQVFKSSDIMILPSRSEGMPVSVLEALSYGLPCILTPETNMADFIEKHKCGWISPLTVDRLSNTIKDAVSNYKEDYHSLIVNAQNSAKQFDWAEIAKKSLKQYVEIILK